MAIRINLLAEAQAAEELRRRDPVKRALWVAGFLIFLVLLWSGSLMLKGTISKSEGKKYEAKWKGIEKNYASVTNNIKKASEIKTKLNALTRYSTNRILWGSTLNALQKTAIDSVQVTRVRAEQSYSLVAPIPAKKMSADKTIPATPGYSTEKVGLTIEAKDYSGTGDYNKFKTKIADFEHFKALLKKPDALRLTSLSQPESEQSEPGKLFVRFTLEARYPETRRNE